MNKVFYIFENGTFGAETEPYSLTTTLEVAQNSLPPGLFRLTRNPDDVASIVETWL